MRSRSASRELYFEYLARRNEFPIKWKISRLRNCFDSIIRKEVRAEAVENLKFYFIKSSATILWMKRHRLNNNDYRRPVKQSIIRRNRARTWNAFARASSLRLLIAPTESDKFKFPLKLNANDNFVHWGVQLNRQSSRERVFDATSANTLFMQFHKFIKAESEECSANWLVGWGERKNVFAQEKPFPGHAIEISVGHVQHVASDKSVEKSKSVFCDFAQEKRIPMKLYASSSLFSSPICMFRIYDLFTMMIVFYRSISVSTS